MAEPASPIVKLCAVDGSVQNGIVAQSIKGLTLGGIPIPAGPQHIDLLPNFDLQQIA